MGRAVRPWLAGTVIVGLALVAAAVVFLVRNPVGSDYQARPVREKYPMTEEELAIPPVEITEAGFPDRRRAQEAQFRRYIHPQVGPEMTDAWLNLARPTVRLAQLDDNLSGKFDVPVPGPDSPVIGRLGGQPDLPVDMDWPTSGEGVPLDFLLQVDLGILAGSGLEDSTDLPEEGLLLAFAEFQDSPESWRDRIRPIEEPEGRLIHTTGPALPRPIPDGARQHPAAPLTAVGSLSLPSSRHAEFQEVLVPLLGEPVVPPLAEALTWAEEDLIFTEDRGPHHQIGGWSSPRFGLPEDGVAPSGSTGDWRLDLQLDWGFGEVGMMFWLHDADTDHALEDSVFVVRGK